MADYGKLLSRIWSDREFVALDARAQQLYCLLISYSSRNLAGVVPMTLKRWANSTADSTVENVTEALKQLEAAGFVVVDWDTEEVLIRTYIRNDEVYRQPNLMKAARKFALQIESPALRWALHTELLRLPDHKEQAETESVAYTLVAGLQKPFTEPIAEPIAEPLPEPFAEPLPEPPGVGVSYVSPVGEHQHQHPATAPAASTAPRPRNRTFSEMVRGTPDVAPPPPPPEPDRGAVATRAAALVAANVAVGQYAETTLVELRDRTRQLLGEDVSDELMAATLRHWDNHTGGPGLLRSMLAEGAKSLRAPFGGTTQTSGAPAPSGASAKAAGWLSITQESPYPNQRGIEA